MKKYKYLLGLTIPLLVMACTQDDALSDGSTSTASTSSNNSAATTSSATDLLSGVAFSGLAQTFNVVFDKSEHADEYEMPDESDAYYEDYIETADGKWTRTVSITFSTSGSATVTGDEKSTVSVSGNKVVVTNASSDKVIYSLSGKTTDGYFLIAAGGGKQEILLNGVDIYNPNGPAINNQSKKRTFVVVAEGTSNYLKDGSGYDTEVVMPGYEDEAEEDQVMMQQKACLFSEGQLIFYGPGYLEVDANCKAGIRSDQYVHVMPTANIYVDADNGNALRGNDGVLITGGVLNLNVTGTADKGISTDGDLTVNGGRITIITSGGYELETEENDDGTTTTDYSACAGFKADGNIVVNNGEIWLKSTGTGGKGMSADGEITINGGTVYALTTGAKKESGSYSTSPKALKADGNITLLGGDIIVRTTGGEGAEGIESKAVLTVGNTADGTGPVVECYTYDDAINSKSTLNIHNGYVYAHSTNNDGMDSNANLYFNGGVTVAEGAGGAECGIDAAEGYTCYINGGTVVAIGGNLQEINSSSKVASITATVGSGTNVGLLSGSKAILGYTTPGGSATALMISSPEMSSGTTYTLRSGCTLSGGTAFYGLRTGCVITTGTSAYDYTASTAVSGSMGGGGMPGGGDGPGGGPGWH